MSFNKEAKAQFLNFATLPGTVWSGNFRDLNASITRMATLAPGGRITPEVVEREKVRLNNAWNQNKPDESTQLLQKYFSIEQIQEIDLFDRAQLSLVIEVCQNSKNIAEAGRTLYQASRKKRSTVNDSDRIRKYLARFGLDWQQISALPDDIVHSRGV